MSDWKDTLRALSHRMKEGERIEEARRRHEMLLKAQRRRTILSRRLTGTRFYTAHGWGREAKAVMSDFAPVLIITARSKPRPRDSQGRKIDDGGLSHFIFFGLRWQGKLHIAYQPRDRDEGTPPRLTYTWPAVRKPDGEFRWRRGQITIDLTGEEDSLLKRKVITPQNFLLDRVARMMAMSVKNSPAPWWEIIPHLVSWPEEEAALVRALEIRHRSKVTSQAVVIKAATPNRGEPHADPIPAEGGGHSGRKANVRAAARQVKE